MVYAVEWAQWFQKHWHNILLLWKLISFIKEKLNIQIKGSQKLLSHTEGVQSWLFQGATAYFPVPPTPVGFIPFPT